MLKLGQQAKHASLGVVGTITSVSVYVDGSVHYCLKTITENGGTSMEMFAEKDLKPI